MKKIIVTGNVGRDPLMRADKSGKQFATFAIGVSVGSKKDMKTDWVEISCNGASANFAQMYVKKGTKLLIEGFPTVKAYLGKDGAPKANLVVYAHNMEFIGSKPKEDESNSDHYTLPDIPESNGDEPTFDDVPF